MVWPSGRIAARLLVLASLFACVAYLHAEDVASYWPANANETSAWTGRLRHVNAHLGILTVRGSPAERGEAHGKLLTAEVSLLVKNVREFLSKSAPERYKQCVDGAVVMGRFIDPDVMAEVRACATAAGVDPDELLLAQLFGDVNRGKGFSAMCSSFAAFGDATINGSLIVGRNFDYGGFGLEGGLPLILQEIPTGPGAGQPFVTLCYAGILNGWTAMNSKGVYANNNTLLGGKNVLEGMATCFLLRKIVERCTTVEEGVDLVLKTPRACTTGMLIAGHNAVGKWDARFVEFDADTTSVVEPAGGLIQATNCMQKLTFGNAPLVPPTTCTRFSALQKYLGERKGKLSFDDLTQNPMAAPGVYVGPNLHCALLDPVGQRIRASFADGDGKPAAEKPPLSFDIKADAVVLHADAPAAK